MKRNIIAKRIFLIIGVMLIASMLFTLSAAAYSEEAEEPLAQGTDAEAVSAADKSDGDVGDQNFFSALYAEARAHLSEIMCALTFVGSLVLTLLYKKGLMPFITRAVEAIGKALGGMKESAEKSSCELGALGQALGKTELAVEKISEHLTAIEKTLGGMKSDEGERERFKAIMGAQVNLLYDIFMNSSIPQYQKDAVGEKIAEMKSALCTEDAEG